MGTKLLRTTGAAALVCGLALGLTAFAGATGTHPSAVISTHQRLTVHRLAVRPSARRLRRLTRRARLTPAAPTVLYDQYDTDSSSGIVSETRSDDASHLSQAADDFVVPAGQSWIISSVDFKGTPIGAAPTGFNVFFYPDSGGVPGVPVAQEAGLAVGGANPDYSATLSPAVTLAPGHYWVSVQAQISAGDWFWEGRNATANTGSVWRNPGAGFGNPSCSTSTWKRTSTCFGGWQDQMFRLHGDYGPVTCGLGQWSSVADYPTTIESPAVGSDGATVYVAGGYDGGGSGKTAAAYKYTPSTNSWTAIASLPVALYDARAVYAPNTGKFYVFGGYNGSALNTTYVYNPGANSWTTGAAMPAARLWESVVYVNGKIYVIGGDDSGFAEQKQTWEYDPIANTWNTTRANIPVGMAGSGAAAVGNDIYLLGSSNGGGGSTLNYRYDVPSNTWTSRAPIPAATYLPATGSFGGKVYLVGGGNPFAPTPLRSRAGAPGRAPLASYTNTRVYDPATNSWSVGPGTAVPHAFTASTMAGARMFVVAGTNGSADTPTVEASTGDRCAKSSVYSQNFDGVTAPALPAGWTAANASGSAPLWVTSNSGIPAPAADSAPNAAFVNDATSVADKRLTGPSLAIQSGSAQISFRNNYSLEGNFDGGVLEISTDGGATFKDILDAGGSFVTGGYTAKISSSFGSPISGRLAWSGSSGGFIDTVVNLPASAAGHTVILRFREASDTSLGLNGWRIDSIVVRDGNRLSVGKAGNGSGTVSGSGISCGSTCGYNYDPGSVVTLTAAPATGSSFTGWSGACSGSGSCTVTMSDAKSVSATFTLQKRNVNVSKKGTGTGKVTSGPAGISCPKACTAPFDYGSSVTLTPKATGKAAFTGWKGDCTGKKACVLSMTADHTVTATFQLCVVPKLVGLTLKKAKKKLAKANCRVGKVRKASSPKSKKGKVLKQSQKRGKKLRYRTKINLTIGKGP